MGRARTGQETHENDDYRILSFQPSKTPHIKAPPAKYHYRALVTLFNIIIFELSHTMLLLYQILFELFNLLLQYFIFHLLAPQKRQG
jgi:hypothetical protein